MLISETVNKGKSTAVKRVDLISWLVSLMDLILRMGLVLALVLVLTFANSMNSIYMAVVMNLHHVPSQWPRYQQRPVRPLSLSRESNLTCDWYLSMGGRPTCVCWPSASTPLMSVEFLCTWARNDTRFTDTKYAVSFDHTFLIWAGLSQEACAFKAL